MAPRVPLRSTRHTFRRPPLSGKQTPPPTTRKERRAAERRDRFEAARDERRRSVASSSGGGASFINTKTMTIVGVLIGVVIVAVVAIGQLGNRGKITDPQVVYPAGLISGASLGKADAPVKMEVYGDFQCPVCAKNALDVEPSLVNKYVASGKLQIVHYDLNLLGRGTDESLTTALGGYCAVQQGKYYDYAHWIYNNQDGENQGGFRRDRVVQIAVAAGLDQAAFTSCLDSSDARTEVDNITNKAINELGIDSTPTIYLNGTKNVGLKSVSDWTTLIDAALAAAAPSAAPASAAPSASAAAPSASAAPSATP